MTDVTVKVLPVAESTRTVLVLGLDQTGRGEAMAAAMRSPHEVSGAAYLPAELAAGSGVSYVSGAAASVTAIRVEGPRPSVEYRCAALRTLLVATGATEELHSRNSARLWAGIARCRADRGAAGCALRLADLGAAGGGRRVSCSA